MGAVSAEPGRATTEPSATAAVQVVRLLSGYLDDVATRLHRSLGDVLGVAVTMATAVDGPVTAGASTTTARAVDTVQYAIGTGPCLNALAGGGGAYVPDLAGDPRWRVYGPRAAELGARSCLSVPVEVDGAVTAVLKVYADRIDGLDEDQRRAAVAAAPDLAGGIRLAQWLQGAADELDDRAAAMDSRRTIDIAIGVLAERAGCDVEQAFALLRRQSQHSNTPVRDVAAELLGDRAAGGAAPFRPRGGTPQP